MVFSDSIYENSGYILRNLNESATQNLGINKFKISGRCDDQEVSLYTMLHFFVKPEFREYISAQVTLITMQDWNWNWVPMFRDAV